MRCLLLALFLSACAAGPGHYHPDPAKNHAIHECILDYRYCQVDMRPAGYCMQQFDACVVRVRAGSPEAQ